MSTLILPEVVDNTMMKDFRSCHRKFFLARMLGLQPNFPSIHLIAGKAYASAMEHYRRAYYTGEEFLPSRNKGIIALIRAWGEQDEFEDDKKSLWNMILAFVATTEHYDPKTDYLSPHMRDGKPLVEFNFVLPIPNTSHPITGQPYLYTGRFDMLADYRVQLMIVDDKTTSSLGQSWISSWEMNSQITGYIWGAKSYGLPVTGAVIRGTSILKTKFEFAESIQYRSQWEIDRWLYQTQKDLLAMQKCWEESYWDFDLGDSCNQFSGCGYRKLCTKQDPSKWIEPDYKVEFWKPLEVSGAKIPEGFET